jgi:D-lactate dehydrogenase (cytochrome)
MPDTTVPYLRNDTGTAMAIEAIKALLGDRLSTAQSVRDQHARGEDYFTPAPPDAVAYVQSTEEVAAVVKVCAEYKVPIIAWGTGTSLEGHVTAPYGGVTIDLSGMDKVLEINGEDFDCRVQAGVLRKSLNEDIRDTGLMFPVDPGANASLGGMAATSASGTNAVRYGTMKENVIGLTVVTPEGNVIKTGGRSRKTSAGYDLTHLYVGSEGTLGIITEVQLRLYGVPEAMAAAICQYEDLQSAVATTVAVLQCGIHVARMELLDEVQMDACIQYSGLNELAVKPTLFFEFHGTEAGVNEQAETVQAITEEMGGSKFSWATKQEDRNRLWQARHDAYYAAMAMVPGKKGWSTDVVVPISRLTECLMDTKKDIEDNGLIAPICGHVGDGNFHCLILLDPDNEAENTAAHAFNNRLVNRALAMGGTCTGEHGIGAGKVGSLAKEAGEAIEYMRRIKRALDPDNIMNPGKVVQV